MEEICAKGVLCTAIQTIRTQFSDRIVQVYLFLLFIIASRLKKTRSPFSSKSSSPGPIILQMRRLVVYFLFLTKANLCSTEKYPKERITNKRMKEVGSPSLFALHAGNRSNLLRLAPPSRLGCVTMAPRPLWEVPLVVIVIFGCEN